MSLQDFTNEQKLAEVNREITQRHRVYGRMVKQGKLDPKRAQLLIRIMQAVADDYAAKVKEGPLFNQAQSS